VIAMCQALCLNQASSAVWRRPARLSVAAYLTPQLWPLPRRRPAAAAAATPHRRVRRRRQRRRSASAY
jgi:hypothetical protein